MSLLCKKCFATFWAFFREIRRLFITLSGHTGVSVSHRQRSSNVDAPKHVRTVQGRSKQVAGKDGPADGYGQDPREKNASF